MRVGWIIIVHVYFTLRDRRTGELFDRWSDFGDKRRRLMEQSWAGVFRNHLLVELPVDDLCRHLDERMGRPSKDLHVVIGVLLLQQLHDLSDAETVEALAGLVRANWLEPPGEVP